MGKDGMTPSEILYAVNKSAAITDMERIYAYNVGQAAINLFWESRGYEIRKGKWWKK